MLNTAFQVARPAPLRPLVANNIHALLGPPLLAALVLRPAPRWLAWLAKRTLRTGARALRWLPRRRQPMLCAQVRGLDYPGGHQIKSLEQRAADQANGAGRSGRTADDRAEIDEFGQQ